MPENESVCRNCGQAIFKRSGVWTLQYVEWADPDVCWSPPDSSFARPSNHEPIPDSELVLVP